MSPTFFIIGVTESSQMINKIQSEITEARYLLFSFFSSLLCTDDILTQLQLLF